MGATEQATLTREESQAQAVTEVEAKARELSDLVGYVDYDVDGGWLNTLHAVLRARYGPFDALAEDDQHWRAAVAGLYGAQRHPRLDAALTTFLAGFVDAYMDADETRGLTVAEWRRMRRQAKEILKAIDAWADSEDTEVAR